MKLLSTIFSLVLIAALATPFLSRPADLPISGYALGSGGDGRDRMAVHPTFGGTAAYQWQDEYGNWQFGERPPADAADARPIRIVPRHTSLEQGWSGPLEHDRDTNALFGEELSVIDVYTGRAADQARKIHTGQ